MHDGVRAAHSDPAERTAPGFREIGIYLITLALLLWPIAVNGKPLLLGRQRKLPPWRRLCNSTPASSSCSNGGNRSSARHQR